MKRDDDLIRELLLRSEQRLSGAVGDSNNYLDLDRLGLKGHDSDTVIGHVKLLRAENFIEGGMLIRADGSVYDVRIECLTPEGHDFLAAIKDDAVWSKTKSQVASAAGTVTLEVLKAVAVAITKGALGLP